MSPVRTLGLVLLVSLPVSGLAAEKKSADAPAATATKTETAASVAKLITTLNAPMTSTDEERRATLALIHASVPDATGVFRQPPRPPKGGPPPEPDWIVALKALPPETPAVAELLAKTEALRALAETKTEDAATAILDFAFTDQGLVFRDECGRLLREMAPHSLPTLLRGSGDKVKHKGSYARYAGYQLDRLDKARPAWALEAAPSDEILIAMLKALGDVKHADAVSAVLAHADAHSSSVRKAARDAWMQYVVGPPPPPAPKAKRKLPGGQLSEEEMPLYLTYRELATEELRRGLVALKTEGAPEGAPPPTPPPANASAEDMTKEYFALLDARRAAQWDGELARAKQLQDAGDLDGLGKIYDGILVTDPLYARRAEMIPGYVALGRAKLTAGDAEAAVVAFGKAVAVDPTGPQAKSAESELYAARAKAAEKRGESGKEELDRAGRLDPNNPTAQKARVDDAKKRAGWMLWGGIAAGAVALALAVWAILARKRAAGGPGTRGTAARTA